MPFITPRLDGNDHGSGSGSGSGNGNGNGNGNGHRHDNDNDRGPLRCETPLGASVQGGRGPR
ncbi:hypothetical protein ACFJIX_20280 [Roseateles sp. UC29_93]|uniref:hypothetical protein n=1 Tax=Roseateles sp. UC29_93 TaxID=3350177 RepID=UPI00366D6896